MSAGLTTHVLDTARGRPAEGVGLVLRRTDVPIILAQTITNADGRCDAPLLPAAALEAGIYELVFEVAPYFARWFPNLPDPPFLSIIALRFGVSSAHTHHHVPLLISPYGYSTYRGS